MAVGTGLEVAGRVAHGSRVQAFRRHLQKAYAKPVARSVAATVIATMLVFQGLYNIGLNDS